jgi:hypothetical protein
MVIEIAPYMLKECFAINRCTLMLDEIFEKIKLKGRESYFFFAFRNTSFEKVDFEIMNTDNTSFIRSASARECLEATNKFL